MTHDQSDIDWWLDVERSLPENCEKNRLPRPELKIETIGQVRPLGSQLGRNPKKTVPDALYEAIFGQSEISEADIGTGAHMNSYAVLDAAKVAKLPEILESSGLEYRCLFKGVAYDNLKDICPWIVRIEDGNAFVRNLFTNGGAYWHLWDCFPGIYIRAGGSLDDLWRHFRKFTRIPDEHGKWYYLRFWEPSWTSAIIRDMQNADAERFMQGISRIIAIRNDGHADIISRGFAAKVPG